MESKPPLSLDLDAPPRPPDWAMPRASSYGAVSEADAAFSAGAALTALDQLARLDPPWAGAWRRRLSIRAAAVAVRLAGRREDEAALRDLWLMRTSAEQLGPAGAIYACFRDLSGPMAAMNSERISRLGEALGLSLASEAGALADLTDDAAQSSRAAPFAVADLVRAVIALRPDAEILAWQLADYALARKLRWSRPVPLLMAERYNAAFQAQAGRGRTKPADPAFAAAVCLALGHGATESLRIAGDLSRRAGRLMAVAPKVRTKGMEPVIRMLLEDDSVAASGMNMGAAGAQLSRWASRRLFDRLMQFDAVRELSGRPTFRVYGL